MISPKRQNNIKEYIHIASSECNESIIGNRQSSDMSSSDISKLANDFWNTSVDLTWSNIPHHQLDMHARLDDENFPFLKQRVEELMSQAEVTPLPEQADDCFDSISELDSTINLDDSRTPPPF
jgi:hypothetical protein